MTSSISRRRASLIAVAGLSGGISTARAKSTAEIGARTISEASAALRAKQTTCSELVGHALSRTQALNPKLNAFISILGDEALRQAAELDREAQAGKFRSPLHGIPVSLKDNIDTAHVRTTAASQVYDNRIPDKDAEVVRRLREAGAVILGKNNLHEFATGGSSAVSFFGPVRNPWDPSRVPGGSSGGSAAAVAAGMGFGSLGTDTGGSIRIPSSHCGVVGFKPTYGLVPISGIVPLIPSLDHCGPITRTVKDAALILNAIAGYDSSDIHSGRFESEDYADGLSKSTSGLRVGVIREPFFDGLDSDIASAAESALLVLRKLVAKVEPAHLPPIEPLSFASFLPERLALHGEILRDSGSRYQIATRIAIEGNLKHLDDPMGGSPSAKLIEYTKARWLLEEMRRRARTAFTDFDLAVMPTLRRLPQKITDALERENNPRAEAPDGNYAACFHFNFLGLPAVSIPCGFSKSGLPVGLMIAGAPGADGLVLRLAHAYESATEWHSRVPS